LSAVDCENNFVRLPRTKKAVIKGLKNMIVIDEGDVLLIYPKGDEQEIKSVRNDLDDDSVL
jgi:mannose-1-phosphate guanylyltransferase